MFLSIWPVEMRPYSEHRARSNTASEIDKPRFHRTRSTQSLKMGECSFEERLNLLSQLFWIFVSLLESDYEYEFLLALRSLDKVRIKLLFVCFFVKDQNYLYASNSY